MVLSRIRSNILTKFSVLDHSVISILGDHQLSQLEKTTRSRTSASIFVLGTTFLLLGSCAVPALGAADKMAALEKQLNAARQAQQEERYVPAERMLKKLVLSADKIVSDLTPADAGATGTLPNQGAQNQPSSTPGTVSQNENNQTARTETAVPATGTAGGEQRSASGGSDAAGTANAAGENVADDPLSKASKLADEAYLCLGDCCGKLLKFNDAEAAYKRAMEIETSRKLQSQAQAKLTGLDDVYRTVKIDQLGERASDVAKQAGIKSVFAVRNGEAENINVELGTRYKKKIDEETIRAGKSLTSSASPNAPSSGDSSNSTGASSSGSGTDSASSSANKLKEIRIDPKLSFLLSKQPNGIKLSNIEGLFVDVGLWVKLMEVELLTTDEGPKARVTAGKFGVQKTVDVGVPAKIYDQVRTSIEKLDPFFGIVRSIVGASPGQPTTDAVNSSGEQH